mmetsp:Transcript_34620/g.88840  ORF Transcript_34620/g.88840 Transcript_34620/m.88840 type:complete len:93 (-) Transcript_34620:99-377(-)
MARHPSGWCHRMRSQRVNIWDTQRLRPDKWLIYHPYQEVKFTRPPWLTRWGFPAKPRTEADPRAKRDHKFCNMSMLHKQDEKKPLVQRVVEQ